MWVRHEAPVTEGAKVTQEKTTSVVSPMMGPGYLPRLIHWVNVHSLASSFPRHQQYSYHHQVYSCLTQLKDAHWNHNVQCCTRFSLQHVNVLVQFLPTPLLHVQNLRARYAFSLASSFVVLCVPHDVVPPFFRLSQTSCDVAAR